MEQCQNQSDCCKPCWKRVAMGMVLLGVVVFGVGLQQNPLRAWVSFLCSHFYFMSLALGGIFFVALQWVTGAVWSIAVRRLAESFVSYLPVVLLTFVILCWGMPYLYHWMDLHAVLGDPVLEAKTSYLNLRFFVIRNIGAILIWMFFGLSLVWNSLRQDHVQGDSCWEKNRILSPLFLIFFALTFTMVSFDQIMSLDPHWFSTIFGIYCFSGLFSSALAVITFLAVVLKLRGGFDHVLGAKHFHDLGKFNFAFSIFWAYIAFSQFLLIWYANLPEETSYYLHRFHGKWLCVSLALFVVKFVLPFFILLPEPAKKHLKIAMFMSGVILIGQWIDIIWMVQPEFFPEGPQLGWLEFGVWIGFLGCFGLCVGSFLSRYPKIPSGDPRLVVEHD